MKRKREMEEKETEIIRSAIEELCMIFTLKLNNNSNIYEQKLPLLTMADVQHEEEEADVVNIPTRPFLSICYLLLQVLEKIGPTMIVLREDVYKNIQRLEKVCDSDPTYSNLVEIIKKEAVEGTAKKSDSSSRALVWLTRSLDFTSALLQRIAMNPRGSMEQMVAESYEITLKPWHGWISSAAYKVALMLVPDTSTFISLLMGKGQDIRALQDEIHDLLSFLHPLLHDVHSLLKSYELGRMKCT